MVKKYIKTVGTVFIFVVAAALGYFSYLTYSINSSLPQSTQPNQTSFTITMNQYDTALNNSLITAIGLSIIAIALVVYGTIMLVL